MVSKTNEKTTLMGMNKAFLWKFFCLISLSQITYICNAQLVTEKRIELELKDAENDEFNVISFGDKGILLLNSRANNFGRKLDINFTKYDTTLSQVWTNSYQPSLLFKLVKYYESESYLYCLFREEEKENITILRLDIATGDYVISESRLLTTMDIDLFSVLKSKALIGGRYNDRPVVEMINLFANTAKVLPEIHSNNVKLNNIQVNEAEGLVYVLLKNSRNCKLFLKVYDYDGKIIGSKTLGEKNKLPLNGRLIQIPNGDYVLAGNYADNCSDYSVGFYTHSLTREEDTKYYDFVDLDNFLSYMPKKRQNRLKTRIKKKNLKGKDFKLRQRLILQDPTENPEGMTIMAEVFYPEYKNYVSNFNSVGRNYRWGDNNYYTYNNFRYTHALILNFDKNGKLIWDSSISLKDLESRTLDHKVQFSVIGDKYILAYPDEGTIKTSIIDRNSETVEELPLELSDENQRVIDTYQSELSAWYGHNFIAYGIQSVRKNTTAYSKHVFYLSKLTYE
ncbi:hypothetical protein [Arcticibacterium luteifluviistationis]|uniref:Uncharacterized protein n=1 Tax=Arcticibacterium luteifluviistationis TaxID=1784714 RepID=A0A2Z4GHN4_9BACT|nr:hypothetical protein [Arcticibacterium luteifluviistationis]AWW00515.1 hypothetical protein DJ013_20950 [Arcticibacterium luteifluviistationis]